MLCESPGLKETKRVLRSSHLQSTWSEVTRAWEDSGTAFRDGYKKVPSHFVSLSALSNSTPDPLVLMTSTNLPTASNPGPFGHSQRKNFLFPDNYTQFNHGSFGKKAFMVQRQGRRQRESEKNFLDTGSTDMDSFSPFVPSLGTFPKVVQDDMLAWHQHAEKDIGNGEKDPPPCTLVFL